MYNLTFTRCFAIQTKNLFIKIANNEDLQELSVTNFEIYRAHFSIYNIFGQVMFLLHIRSGKSKIMLSVVVHLICMCNRQPLAKTRIKITGQK